jgi:hypothetical protein
MHAFDERLNKYYQSGHTQVARINCQEHHVEHMPHLNPKWAHQAKSHNQVSTANVYGRLIGGEYDKAQQNCLNFAKFLDDLDYVMMVESQAEQDVVCPSLETRSNSKFELSDTIYKRTLDLLYRDLFLNCTLEQIDAKGIYKIHKSANGIITAQIRKTPQDTSHTKNVAGPNGKDANQPNDEWAYCKLCCENTVDTCFQPCNHCIVCTKCLLDMIATGITETGQFHQPCPICRKLILKCINIIL